MVEIRKALRSWAIQKADTSLGDREKELKCPDEYYTNYEQCHCNVKQKEIDEAKNAVESVKNSENESKLLELKFDKEKHYNEVHYLTEDARNKALGDIDARRISLGQLAGQLMGFIGKSEEVQNALVKGLQSNVNQLDKLLKASCGDKGCCEYNDEKFIKEQLKSVQNNFKEAEKDDKRLNNILADGNITQLQSQLVQPKKQIQQKIDELNQRISELKKADENAKKSGQSLQNASEIDKLNKDLDSHNASKRSLETLSGICGYAVSLIQKPKNDGECKDILDKLCSGLENFLGFNPESKGYSGTGIVYSDLDRLCDGVMAFLHGVLQDVHTKQPYNVGKTILHENVLSHFNGNLCSGHNGFKSVIETVAQGVGRYNEGVKASNKKVSEPITDILLQVGEEFKKKVSDVLKDNVVAGDANKKIQQAKWDVDMRLEECQENARTFNDTLNVDKHTDIKQAINDLNPTLALRVNNALRAVSHESDRLKALSDKQKIDLQAATEKITEVMKKHGKEVNCKVTDQVSVLVDYLKRKVEEILRLLEGINKRLQDYVAELGRWFDKANDAIKVAEKKVEAILNQVNGSSKNAFETAATLVQSAAEQMGEVVEAGKKRVAQDVAAALEKVKGVNLALKTDLKLLKEQVAEGIRTYVQGYVSAIRSVVIKIKGGSRDKKGLQGIKDRVRGCATDFKTNFQKAIGEMVKTLVDSDGIQKLLAWYFDNNRHTTLNGKNLNNLTDAIKNQFKTITSTSPAIKASDDVQDTLQSIQKYLEGYAAAVNGKLNGGMSGFIRDMFASHLSGSTYSYDQHLEKTIKTILTAAHSTVERVNEELKSLTTDDAPPIFNLGKNINDAFSAADGIVNKLKTAVTNGAVDLATASAITPNGPYNLEDRIDLKVNAVLDYIIGKEDLQGKVPIKTTIFGAYKNYINQDTPVTSATKPDQLKGHLPEAINTIQTELTKALQPIDQAYATLFLQVSDINSSVSQLCHAINEAAGKEQTDPQYKDSIKKRLSDLKALINDDVATINGKKHKGLSKIHAELDELRSSLMSGPMKKAQDFIRKEVSTIKLQTLTCIHKYVDQKVTEAENALTAQAQKQYVTSIQAMLKAFCEKVEKDLHGLPEEIAADLEKGHKWFMDRFDRHFVAKVDEIKAIENIIPMSMPKKESPLSKGAEILKEASRDLFAKLKAQKDFDSDYKLTRSLNAALTKLLGGLTTSQHFDDAFSKNLESVKNELHKFQASKFGDGDYPWLLESFRKGFNAFTGEMEKAYVSYYSGRTIKWNSAGEAERNKYAEICVTIMRILYTDLFRLKAELDGSDTKWTAYNIYNPRKSTHSLHKLFFRDSGYDPSLPGNTAHGELNHKTVFTGKQIKGLLDHVLPGASQLKITIKNKQHSDVNVLQIIQYLNNHVNKYYDACHLRLPSSTKYPCSIRDILSWFSGLPHTAVYGKVFNHCHQLLKKDASYQNDPVLKPLLDLDLFSYIVYTCRKSHDVLAAIQGHGNGAPNADYPYASNFCDNSRSLYYPSEVSALLDMLYDVVKRLCYALYFLYTQCLNGASASNGWRGCAYGQAIPSPRWQCKGHPNTKPSDQPNSHSTDQPNCQPTSPLQGYLTDTLPGWLPHRLTSVGCSAKCATCTKASRGQQCITPMGFWDLYDAGSIVGSGKDICKLLADLCADADAVLFKLYRGLSLLSPSPPKTLGDMTSFFCHLLRLWDSSKKFAANSELTYHMNDKTIPNCFPLQPTLHGSPDASQLTNALRDLYYYKDGHNGKAAKDDTHCDLSSLVASSTLCLGRLCTPYLQPLCHDGSHTYALKHANLYLSWLTYLPFDFYNLLKSLFDAFCNIDCKASGCPSCNCPTGKHGVTEPNPEPNGKPNTEASTSPSAQPTSEPNAQPKPGCHCQSIVQCTGVQPMLFKYGLTFGNPERLMNGSSRKTCDNFCAQLKKVIESDHFRKLFKVIDNFIWAIRTPFSYLLVTLWSLSLLYLLHIAVVRLDVLRIRSHLRSPSSHRIAAQSLLAAARVKALANVKYFSP
ncbi:hypothetical protein, conserved [Babesia ovata]|uniref:C3H1-type domain-containing protein n=1 Tax=Babesia ovata TaxID=189622 RepID=A0A2H6KIV1_9APIC|nr:uncharacterized protein BOVATA_044150 [Babesia ovata]GBE62922.1 hypothetical protein, conserved [Babesia ovata]